MTQVYRLVYASKANVMLGETGINLEISRILLKSKSNNAKANIGGVLYFADGYFFQLLEGEKSAVTSLYHKISADNRHSDATILIEGYTDQPQFSKWSMHFIAADSSIRQLLQDHDFRVFLPFKMPIPLIEQVIAVLGNNGTYERTHKKNLIKRLKNFLFSK
jgi:hypothetical protein